MEKSQIKNVSEISGSVAAIADIGASSLDSGQAAFCDGDLGTLQQVMYGKQLVQQNRQMLKLQAYVDERITNLQKRFERKLEGINRKIDKSVTDLGGQIRDGQKSNAIDLTENNESLRVLAACLALQLSQTDSSNDNFHTQLQSQLDETGVEFTESVRASVSEIVKHLDIAVSEVVEAKVQSS